MEEIDYFKGVTNQEFIDYYKLDLYSRMEITLYTYPNEMTEEDPIPWEHFNRCEGILYEYLYNAYAEAQFQRGQQQEKNEGAEILNSDDQQSDSDQIKIIVTAEQRAESYKMEQEERNTIVRSKMQELRPELSKLQNDYLKKVKLTFIDL
ncbi:hypothetical protein [Flavobacterium branchiicola]|uniref:Uncharacterized protein n=1 Tax=Flavobacterium branchiicola TaxID=1114875 RepID=A0ABV9P9H1_9FLAO|nr:hypothetical protein [Flavobacterium branchiicola]MBS7253293.1 hypothetical protein [Flavobacterium branchiicola]